MAEDRLGRGIIMYAARSNHDSIFKKVCGTYKRASTANAWAEEVDKIDHTGKTLLHHAAGFGSFEVLDEVVQLCLKTTDGGTLHRSADHMGRTPIMHVLRHKFKYREGDIERKFDLLGRKTMKDDWLAPRPVRPRNHVRGFTPVGSTGLMHAAQGGPEALNLALGKIRDLHGSDVVKLERVLAMSFVPTTEGDSDRKYTGQLGLHQDLDRSDVHQVTPYTWGCGMLLAAAAKGGSVEVLDMVVPAVEVSCRIAIWSPAQLSMILMDH